MWWFSRYPSHLPFAEGPYIPGCADVMTEYSKDTIFMRIYYPTDLKPHIGNFVSHWIPWVPHDSYKNGFAKILMLWEWIVRLMTWFVSGTIYIPAVYGAKVKNASSFQCIVLSHGLGGIRFLYSTLCTELASRGYIVFCTEHRDESACKTYYYKGKEDAETDNKTFIEHLFVKLGTDHFPTRNRQVRKRAQEMIKLIDLVCKLNKGEVPKNILKDVPNERYQQFDLADLVGRLDVDTLTIMGHSFGGATSLVTMEKEKRIKQGILLDPWMFPIKDMPELVENIKQPMLIINTQTFHIKSNIKALQAIYEVDVDKRPMFTILHSTHESQTDTTFVVGYWLNWFMKKLKPATAAKINSSLILQFLNKYTNNKIDIKDCDNYLFSESPNVVKGLTKPWA